MPGLLDIAESTKTVEINGKDVDVFGVSAEGLAYLFQKFPEIRALFAAKSGMNFTAEKLVTLVPPAVAAIIACGTGAVNNKKVEERAARLNLESQAALLEGIVEMTMPNGVGPFVERLTRMFNGFGGAVTNTPDMISLARSKNSSPTATTQ